jgi:hypothetical protein
VDRDDERRRVQEQRVRIRQVHDVDCARRPPDADLLEGESPQARARECRAQHTANVAPVEALRPFTDEQQLVLLVERPRQGGREALDEGANARRGELVSRKQDLH